MITRSWLPRVRESAHSAIVAFGLAVIALVGFGYGALIMTTATSDTPTLALALGFGSLVVSFAALAWLASLFVNSLQ